MKKTLVPAAVAALFVVMTSSSLAWAQETGPDTEACAVAQANLDAVPEPVGVPSDLEQKDAQAREAHNEARAKYFALGENLPEPTNEEGLRLNDRRDDPDVVADLDLLDNILDRQDAIVEVLAKKAPADAAAKELADDQARFAAEQEAVEDATEERDGSCAPPTTENPVPPVEDDDTSGLNPEYDCRDFPLTDGTTAQDILNGDLSDPHKLDLDSDNIACETSENHAGSDSDGDGVIDNRGGVVEEDSLDDTSTGTSGDVVVPQGGVATGGGPA